MLRPRVLRVITILTRCYPWAVYCDRPTQLYLKGRGRGAKKIVVEHFSQITQHRWTNVFISNTSQLTQYCWASIIISNLAGCIGCCNVISAATKLRRFALCAFIYDSYDLIGVLRSLSKDPSISLKQVMLRSRPDHIIIIWHSRIIPPIFIRKVAISRPLTNYTPTVGTWDGYDRSTAIFWRKCYFPGSPSADGSHESEADDRLNIIWIIWMEFEWRSYESFKEYC